MSKPEINNGGPAYPVPNDANVNNQEGMSLREFFAGQALTGMLRDITDREQRQTITRNAMPIAEMCYLLADAMIEARKGGRE